MSTADIALFLAAGALGGVINVLAGGAKLFVFPLLLASGLPPLVANATGTVALWPAQLPALWVNRARLWQQGRGLVARMIPALAGALAGALLLIFSTERAFLVVIPFVLVGAVVLIALGRHTGQLLIRLVGHTRQARASGALMFLAGVYGGFFGAGLGFLILAVLGLAGVSALSEANVEKNALSTAINTTAVVPLMLSGLVHLPAAVVVMLGGLAGGYLGGHLAGRLPEAPMRLGIAALGLVLTLSFLFT